MAHVNTWRLSGSFHFDEWHFYSFLLNWRSVVVGIIDFHTSLGLFFFGGDSVEWTPLSLSLPVTPPYTVPTVTLFTTDYQCLDLSESVPSPPIVDIDCVWFTDTITYSFDSVSQLASSPVVQSTGNFDLSFAASHTEFTIDSTASLCASPLDDNAQIITYPLLNRSQYMQSQQPCATGLQTIRSQLLLNRTLQYASCSAPGLSSFSIFGWHSYCCSWQWICYVAPSAPADWSIPRHPTAPF